MTEPVQARAPRSTRAGEAGEATTASRPDRRRRAAGAHAVYGSCSQDESDLVIVGECGNGSRRRHAYRAATSRISSCWTFRCPRSMASESSARSARSRMPAVIFVTASDAHAVRAFEVHAVDYVLKPVDRDRLMEAIGAPSTARRDRRS